MAVTFITSTGERIQAEFPPSLMKPGITQAQRERYLIAQGVLSDPSMPDAPAPVQEVIDNLQAEQQQQQQIAVDLLRQQLDELQGRLNNQPLSNCPL